MRWEGLRQSIDLQARDHAQRRVLKRQSLVDHTTQTPGLGLTLSMTFFYFNVTIIEVKMRFLDGARDDSQRGRFNARFNLPILNKVVSLAFDL